MTVPIPAKNAALGDPEVYNADQTQILESPQSQVEENPSKSRHFTENNKSDQINRADAAYLQAVQAAGGDMQEAFASLFIKHLPTLKNLAVLKGAGASNREDILQNVAEKVLQGCGAFELTDKGVAGWFTRITINTAYDFYRGNRFQRKAVQVEYYESEDEVRQHEPSSRHNANLEDTTIQRLAVATALHELEAEDTTMRTGVEVLRAFYFEDRSYEDCAELFGVKVGTIKSRLNRTRKALRPILERLIATPEVS